MTPAKLTGAELVLEWVYEQTRETYAGRGYDTATAEYLAECVRLRQAWDHLEGPAGCDYEYAPCIFDALRAALEGVK